MSDGDRDSDDLDWDEVARLPDESDGCFANVRSQEIAKPKRNYDLPHLSKRTKEQHVFTAHKIPRRKAMMNSRRLKQQSKEQANNVTALIRDSFFCWTVRDGFQPQLPSIRLARQKKNLHSRRDEDIRLRSIDGNSSTRSCCTCVLHE